VNKEIYYSKSKNKTYTALVPAGYEGGYGPNIKAMVLMMKSACNMSESKILDFLHNGKIIISAGTVSNMLIKGKEEFHEELCELAVILPRFLQICEMFLPHLDPFF